MIQAIVAADTYLVRQQVLWPDKSLEFVKVADDGDGLHFGFFVHTELVSVISLFIDPQKTARFRKFATLPRFQQKGIGSQLLYHVFEKATQHGATYIWCDARLEAMAFYERFGMKQEGHIFHKEGTAYTKMSKKL